MSLPAQTQNTTVGRKQKGAHTMKELTEAVCVMKNRATPLRMRKGRLANILSVKLATPSIKQQTGRTSKITNRVIPVTSPRQDAEEVFFPVKILKA